MICKRTRGLSLIEVMVTASLFGLILTMVGKAMVTAHRTESAISHKVRIVRHASLALDMLVRDVEVAVQSSRIYYLNSSNTRLVVPAAPYVLISPEEFRVDRLQRQGLPASLPELISVGYWWDNTDFTFRRRRYSLAGAVPVPLPEEQIAGKVLVEDVKNFEIQQALEPTSGLSILTARLRVATIGSPISVAVALAP